MWKCPKCNVEFVNSVKNCPDCNYEREVKPILLYIANILCTINVIWLITFGLLHVLELGILYWIGTFALIISLIGLWMFKTWGLWLLAACILLIGFTLGISNLTINLLGSIIVLAMYISKAAWLD